MFLLLGFAAREGHVFGWDTAVWRFLHDREQAAQGSVVNHAAGQVVDVGGNAATLFVGIVSLAVLVVRRRVRDALFVVATGVAILTLTPLAKDVFERAQLHYSFPSGNSARSAAMVAAAVFLAWPTRLRWPALFAGIVLTVTVGLALVYENWHLPSDVLGGWCLGIGCATALRWAVGASVDPAHASATQSRVR